MPTFTGKTFSSFYKNLLGLNQSSNTGVDATRRVIHDGAGQSTSVSLSDDVLSVQPITHNTTGTFLVKNQGGNNILAVDTTNSKVLGGTSQTSLNTQYVYFGADYANASAYAADTHYGIPFNHGGSNVTLAAMGTSSTSSFNDTNPATSLTISTNAQLYANVYWLVMDNITIDGVTWIHSHDVAATNNTCAHLMGYTVDLANGSTGGDLSSGVVLADGATVVNGGYEAIYYQEMTVQSANVDAGDIILFTFAQDGDAVGDYSINATVKYHIR